MVAPVTLTHGKHTKTPFFTLTHLCSNAKSTCTSTGLQQLNPGRLQAAFWFLDPDRVQGVCVVVRVLYLVCLLSRAVLTKLLR